MNILILRKAMIISAILGLAVAIIGLVPFLIIYIVLFLSFFVAPLVIVYMKSKNLLGILDMQQSAFFGAVSGFSASIAFFVLFVPGVLFLRLLFKQYYTYAIQYFVSFQTLWLFLIILAILAGILALTNSVTAMGVNYIYTQIEKLPEDADAPVDIRVDEGV